MGKHIAICMEWAIISVCDREVCAWKQEEFTVKQFHWKGLAAGALACALLVGLTACGSQDSSETVSPTPTQTPVQTQSAAPETTPAETETPPAETTPSAQESPSTASAKQPEDSGEAETTGDYSGVTAIGDSVMLGAKDEMEKSMKGIMVEASESRQIWSGKDVAEELAAKGKLGNTVILALGTNGTFKKSTARELLDYFGADRTIYWVTAYGSKLSWQDQVNETIEEVGAEYDNVHILHWDEVGPQHADWFYKDGLHLNGAGRKGYAQFLKDNIG